MKNRILISAVAIAITAASLLIPLLVNLNLEPSALGTPATWYVTAVATILAIAAVRQQRVWAWNGLYVLTVVLLSWGGPDSLFVSGLAGAIGLVGAAHAISVGLESSERQRLEFLEQAKATQAASAADSAIRKERSERIAATLGGALPILEKIASGHFSSSDQREATILEAELRDEIRGRMLINPKLKTSVRSARSRGVEVVVLDEGGLAALSEQDKDSLRDRLAKIKLGCCSKAVCALAKVNLVQVQLQNLIFRQTAFDFQCHHDFAELARQGFFVGQEKISCHLHGDGAGAFSGAARC